MISNDLAMCTEKVNKFFNLDLNVSELKRILNIINTWHSQVIDLKFFKKATISAVTEHYLQLFGFLPKINRCLYYCEWCKVTSSSKSRYEKHRQIHESKFACPQCQRGFKKRGYLINHLRTMHGTESQAKSDLFTVGSVNEIRLTTIPDAKAHRDCSALP